MSLVETGTVFLLL